MNAQHLFMILLRGSLYDRKIDLAAISYNEALSIYQHTLGANSVEVGHTLGNLGELYDAKQDLRTAYRYYIDSITVFKICFGKNHLLVSWVLNSMSINLARRKQYKKATELCTVALRIRRQNLPEGHFEIADTLTTLAQILDDSNKDEQALRFYSEALSIYKNIKIILETKARRFSHV